MNTLLKIGLLGTFLLSFYHVSQAQKFAEYEVKAAYLEKFTRFVEWPESIQIEDTSKPFVIGIVGVTAISHEIEKMYLTKKIRSKKVIVKQIINIKNVDECNLLFIADSDANQIKKILEVVRKNSILTISDREKYSGNGIQIILFIEKKHIVFEIDKNAVEQSGLYMNSMLFELSKNIN